MTLSLDVLQVPNRDKDRKEKPFDRLLEESIRIIINAPNNIE